MRKVLTLLWYNEAKYETKNFGPEATQRANLCYNKRQTYPSNRSSMPIALWDVVSPIICRKSTDRWRWGRQYYASAVFYPYEDNWKAFLLEAKSTPVI
jgi:hypothetical protein